MDPDTVSRLQKMVVDAGEVNGYEAAETYFQEFQLQIIVDDECLGSAPIQAALLTAVNTGVRAFPGGVTVVVPHDVPCTVAWHAHESLMQAIKSVGGALGAELSDQHPTIVFGEPQRPVAGRPVLFASAWGWCAMVAPKPYVRDLPAIAPASMLCGGLAVAEAFQARRGDVFAGRRKTGISLWRPDAEVDEEEAVGPELQYLFAEAWLIGLGHLGQAFAWGLGLLPIPDRSAFRLMLQDDDVITRANMDTSLLAHSTDIGRLKTRHICERLQGIGFAPRITERRLEKEQRVHSQEPQMAFVGVDSPEARKVLSSCNYQRVVDLGLGAGPEDYLGIDLHRFPASRSSELVFSATTSASRRGRRLLEENDAYRQLAAKGDRCGVLEIARRTVATSFVGTVAAAIGIADPLRALHSGVDIEVLSLSLRDAATIEHSGAVPSDPTLLPRYQTV